MQTLELEASTEDKVPAVVRASVAMAVMVAQVEMTTVVVVKALQVVAVD